MSLGIIIVHGYTGSSQELKPIEDVLAINFGKDAVKSISLPGHGPESYSDFDEDLFVETIHRTFQTYKNQNRKIILIGHSTGGNLVVSTLQKFSLKPKLLILVSVPKKVDWEYFKRFSLHRSGKRNVPLSDIAMMVKVINSTGSHQFRSEFPALIVHGENDSLVPSSESFAWNQENFSMSARVVIIPEADHDIFRGLNNHLAIDILQRAIQDLCSHDNNHKKIINSLIEVEPNLKDYFSVSPSSESHLALCPSAQRIIENKPELLPTVMNDPIIANIEITTYCNLQCKFCARSQLKKNNKHMPLDMFRNILALLPHVYKIVLVGLGEPLLHPQIVDFIQYAKSLKKNVGLVTNAMLLTPEISSKLLTAGLDSIAFSIDGFDEHTSSLVRKGTDISKVIKNIKEFVDISNSSWKISKAVFSAVSIQTVYSLQDLIDRVSDLGVDVLMLSDINFVSNSQYTLWQNTNENVEETIRKAISYAFSKKLPVLSVHGLEEFGLAERYNDFLMIPPGQLYQRSKKHTWCFSPWQTVPIDVDGNITFCDCQPDVVIGNLFHDSFSQIWNGKITRKYRAEMLSENPPDACKICPRF